MELKEKDVWVPWTNTDLTEGRGDSIPLCVCKTEATANRRAKKNDVQGTNCTVTKEKAYYIGRHWYVRGVIEDTNLQDVLDQKRLDAAHLKEAAKKAVIAKAIELGLSKEEAELL